jgi:hypothetical protein
MNVNRIFCFPICFSYHLAFMQHQNSSQSLAEFFQLHGFGIDKDKKAIEKPADVASGSWDMKLIKFSESVGLPTWIWLYITLMQGSGQFGILHQSFKLP